VRESEGERGGAYKRGETLANRKGLIDALYAKGIWN